MWVEFSSFCKTPGFLIVFKSCEQTSGIGKLWVSDNLSWLNSFTDNDKGWPTYNFSLPTSIHYQAVRWWEYVKSSTSIARKRNRQLCAQATQFTCKARAKRRMRVDESWLSWEFPSTLIDYHEAWAKREKALDGSQEKFEQVQIRWECMRVSGQTRVRVWTLIKLSSSFGRQGNLIIFVNLKLFSKLRW